MYEQLNVKTFLKMSTEATSKKTMVKQVLTIAVGVVVGLTLVKLGELGIKKAMALKKP